MVVGQYTFPAASADHCLLPSITNCFGISSFDRSINSFRDIKFRQGIQLNAYCCWLRAQPPHRKSLLMGCHTAVSRVVTSVPYIYHSLLLFLDFMRLGISMFNGDLTKYCSSLLVWISDGNRRWDGAHPVHRGGNYNRASPSACGGLQPSTSRSLSGCYETLGNILASKWEAMLRGRP